MLVLYTLLQVSLVEIFASEVVETTSEVVETTSEVSIEEVRPANSGVK